MTVADNYDIEKQETNGTTKIFSFNFYTASKDFVKVILEVDGEQSIVPTTDYTIKLNTLGGTVTFTRAPASGGYIIIVRETPHEQETSFATSSGFPAKTVEGRFDKLTAMIQEMQDTDNRTPSFPVGTDLNVTLPLPEAGKALIWNEDEDNLENSQTTFDEIVSDAISAKNDAVAAKEAAETAQGKAEDAQRDAESAQAAAEIAQGKAEDAKTSAENTVAGFDDHADSKIGEVNTLVGQAEGYATVAENKANAAAGSANDASGYATAASGYASAASTSASNAAAWAEGTDEEVEALGGEHSAKEWNSILSSSIGDATLTIQRNSEQLATFTANSSTDTTVNITVPTSASDVGALPNTTKYGASVALSINTSTYVMTAQLKDQNGNNLGSAATIDLPLESVVVNGSYDAPSKKIILTLQSGSTIEIPVADLVAGLQSEITSDNMLDADLVDDSTSTNQFVTASDKTTWNGKQDAIADLQTIRDGAAAGATAVQDTTVDGTSVVTDGVAVIPNASGQTKGVVSLTNSLVSTSNTTALAASTINIYSENVLGVQRFSSSSTYDVGDRVRNGQYYFQCNTAITTPHAWDASEWTQTTILDEIDAKVSDTTVAGTSVVNNGVAVIPIAQQSGGYGLVKLSDINTGLTISSSGNLVISAASNLNIDGKSNVYKPIVPSNLDYAVKRGVAYNSLTLTDAEKASACSFVGALPNNIYGESTTAASTVQKEVSIPSITSLNAGQLIIVTPTTTSTVANSTLKLNDFDAYPMLYAGNAITTSTDSYVWIKDVPGWWLFDGSNWLFAGHGYDYNTTYSTMTVANIIKGTETSARLMRSDYLKDGICGVVTDYDSGDTITPSDKYLYTSTSDISTLTVNAPTSPDVRYVSQINFSSGTTATTLSYPNTFKVIDGCDDVQTINGVRVFVPVANKRYQMFILNDGINNLIIAKGA